MAGWKYAKVSGTVTKLSDNAAYVARTDTMLASFAQALIDTGVWSLDERFASVNEPHAIHSMPSSGYHYNALILRNAAGAKLFIGYSCKGQNTANYFNHVFPDSYSCSDMEGNTSYRRCFAGLMMSMIPADSDEDFTLNEGGVKGLTIPDSATRLTSTTCSSGSVDSLAYHTSPTELSYTYHFLTKGNVVIVLLKHGNDSADCGGGFIVGEIFGSLAHGSDSRCGCRYGVIDLASRTSENAKASAGICQNSWYTMTHTSSARMPSFSFKRADGTHVPGYKIAINADTNQLNTSFCSCTSSTARYVPMWMAESSDTPSETGVVTDDGFKGYISTDILRVMRYDKFSRGQLFDGGQFVYVGGGIALAWDPSITESIF